MSSESVSAALIVAHPGHETLLHHWIEQVRPVVFVLTDGSGGAEHSRLDYTRALLQRTGASCGGVFGIQPDREWYAAILGGDASPFHQAAVGIESECAARCVDTLVSDPVELFNPMHDLANVVAHAVARRLKVRRGAAPCMLTYPIEQAADAASGAPVWLSQPAAARKSAAIQAYTPLAHELPRYRELVERDHELLRADSGYPWPVTPQEEPYYERFGRQRLRQGLYGKLITYAEHVRPIAVNLLGSDDAR